LQLLFRLRDNMLIFVNTFKGYQFTLNVDLNDSIENIKFMIYYKEDIPTQY